jgi:hypothetical protein
VTWDISKISVFSRDQAGQVQRLPQSATLARPVIQAKLEIGAVDDPLERESDHVAERVTRMPDSAAHTTPTALETHSKHEAGYPTLCSPEVSAQMLKVASYLPTN